MSWKLNNFTGKFDFYKDVKQLTSDPTSPVAQDMWVLATASYSDGTPMGLLLAITQAAVTGYTYALKYRTLEDTTKSVALT